MKRYALLVVGALVSSIALAAPLDEWRRQAAEVRALADNDAPQAYSRAQQLQDELPPDATPADRARVLNLLSRIEVYLALTDVAARNAEQARELARSRVICVLGAGGDRDRAKRPVMGRIASELADIAIVTSDNPRSEDPDVIIAEVLSGAAVDVQVEPDRAAAIRRALELADEGDVVVIAGKGHEQGQELADRVEPFDDREVARATLRRLGATS
jgi:hypothetical protein